MPTGSYETRPSRAGRLLPTVVACLMTCIGLVPCLAQVEIHRIVFVDKGTAPFTPGAPLYEATLSTFHPDALQRRMQLGMQPLLTERDRPIPQAYLDELAAAGASIRSASNWGAFVLAEIDPATAAGLRAQTQRYASVRPVGTSDYIPLIGSNDDADLPTCAPPRYGESHVTSSLIGALPLHEAGVYGQGAVVGLIDNGFRWRTIAGLQHADVRGEYDVIYGDDTTANGPNDPADQDGHGTLVMSILAGYMTDSIVGVAPASTLLLAKAEDMRWERRIEEEDYFLAVEWMERNGAQIISSSLGYRRFDSTDRSISYMQLDGKTTTPAQAVNIAAQFGVICVTAVGNGGPADSSLITPADADSVVAVGGTLRSGNPYGFSASGPTADGRIKPDIAALGAKVPALGTGEQRIVRPDGTSMAAPAIAGAFSLLRSIYPDLPSWSLRRALFETAEFPLLKDSSLGHGLPNVAKAAARLGPGPVRPSVIIRDGRRYVVCTVFNEAPVQCTLRVRSVGTTSWTEVLPTLTQHPIYEFPLDNGASATDLEYQVQASFNGLERTWPARGVGTLPSEGSDVACGATLPSFITSVHADRQLPRLRVAPNVVTDARRAVRVMGLVAVPVRARIASMSTGADADAAWSLTDGGSNLLLRIDELAAGRYALLLTMSDGTLHTAPFTIVR